MLFGFVLPGYEFDGDLEHMEPSSGEAASGGEHDEVTKPASAAPADA